MSLAIYANVTKIDGATARCLKANIRNRIRSGGYVATSIYRNPVSPDGHAYRFIRVHIKPRNTP